MTPTVIYIMGYGRSGSTILDILLNQHPEVMSVGAVGELYRWLLAGERCGCLLPIRDCGFWSAVCAHHVSTDEAQEIASLQFSIESLRNVPALLFSLNRRERIAAYRRQTRSLFGAIAHVSGKRWIVDSSKSARHYTGRAVALERYAGLEVRTIHLVRDPCGVGWSAMRGAGSPERESHVRDPRVNFARTLASWTATNALAFVTTRLLRRRALRVRYEDLCASPRAVLNEIGKFVGLDMSAIVRKVEAGETLAVSHNVGGNRVRFSRGLRFSPDEEWRDKLPGAYRRTARIATWPVRRVLGYP